MSKRVTRREMLQRAGQAVVAGALAPYLCLGQQRNASVKSNLGAIVGDTVAEKVGQRILADGGNAIDAAIGAALAVCITSPSRCGIGGYGGHMIIGLAGEKKVVSIDFNSMAPAAARADMYPLDEKGEVEGRANFHGWRALGVPGTLAGFELALRRYGTRSFRELAQPAIEYAREGFPVFSGLANAIRSAAPRFRADPGSARIYLQDDEPIKAGDTLRNPDLGKLLSTLAGRDSVDSFYRGDIAQSIADAIQKNGGLVTAQDMAAYQAREVEPLSLKWNELTILTAPLTAGGLTTLEAMNILKSLKWDKLRPSTAATHARLEAVRVAWKDRLELLGDPEKVKVPVDRLLSSAYALEVAGAIQRAVKAQKPLTVEIQKHLQDGTTNLSCVDAQGNMIAMTFTQGGGFGAQVTVDGLGLTLGHGMSRFNPRPGHPNSPGPHKRPLHNMCPSLVLRHGRPVMAVGAAGGVKIPNTLFDVLAQYVVRGKTMEQAVAAPRLLCTGTLDVTLENEWPKDEADYLKRIGFKIQTGPGANASAVSFNPKTGECRGEAR
jgi:gamma-glutamyltranspeptidase/glutathione hydrolase